MKVFFDHQIFYPRYGGASKYFVMLMKHMPQDSWITSTLFSSNEYVKETQIFKSYPYLFKGQAFFLEHLNRLYSKFILQRGDFDVYHQTNFGIYGLKNLGNKPMVTTYHDSNLSTIDPHPEIVKRQAISLRRADAIITVSKNTKNDLLNLFDVDSKKIHVVYHGIEKVNLCMLPSQKVYKFPYVLFVGRRSKYKNFDNFLKAFSLIHQKNKDIHLVCTSVPFNEDEKVKIATLKLTSFVHHIFADEIMMKQLYRDAEFFVYPSFYEGFGMPILESWSCGCPVVLSNASCFPEIAKDAGIYFNPNSIEDMANKMNLMLEDTELKSDITNKGISRLTEFSWNKCAERHMNIYRSII